MAQEDTRPGCGLTGNLSCSPGFWNCRERLPSLWPSCACCLSARVLEGVYVVLGWGGVVAGTGMQSGGQSTPWPLSDLEQSTSLCFDFLIYKMGEGPGLHMLHADILMVKGPVENQAKWFALRS